MQDYVIIPHSSLREIEHTLWRLLRDAQCAEVNLGRNALDVRVAHSLCQYAFMYGHYIGALPTTEQFDSDYHEWFANKSAELQRNVSLRKTKKCEKTLLL